MANARSARDWFLARAKDEAAVAKHFVADLDQRARSDGASASRPENMFVFWDWVGGRYSLWSSIGLPIALAVGLRPLRADARRRARDGRALPHRADRAERADRARPARRVVRQRARRATRTRCCPTSSTCSGCPPTCSSSTWRATASASIATGARSTVQTVPIVWGEPGTNGQHAFYQLLHQGTRADLDRLPGRHRVARSSSAIITGCWSPTASRRPRR